jgi:hypothetical protein
MHLGRCLLLFALLIGACGNDRQPYEALPGRAAKYVIPGSDRWSFGELCPDGGDCSGAVDEQVIAGFEWLRFSAVNVVDDHDGGERTVDVTLSVLGGGEVRAQRVKVRAWGPSMVEAQRVLGEGFQLWAGVDRGEEYVLVFVAVDERGRFAAVGHAAAEYFTIPAAVLAADAGAPSGEAYLTSLMAR